jgi:peptidoglycan/LPS O-acetylase OafA/YrhL
MAIPIFNLGKISFPLYLFHLSIICSAGCGAVCLFAAYGSVSQFKAR